MQVPEGYSIEDFNKRKTVATFLGYNCRNSSYNHYILFYKDLIVEDEHNYKLKWNPIDCKYDSDQMRNTMKDQNISFDENLPNEVVFEIIYEYIIGSQNV